MRRAASQSLTSKPLCAAIVSIVLAGSADVRAIEPSPEDVHAAMQEGDSAKVLDLFGQLDRRVRTAFENTRYVVHDTDQLTGETYEQTLGYHHQAVFLNNRAIYSLHRGALIDRARTELNAFDRHIQVGSMMDALAAIHDVGRLEAFHRARGTNQQKFDASSKYQHQYTVPVLKKVLGKAGFRAESVALAELVLQASAVLSKTVHQRYQGQQLLGPDAALQQIERLCQTSLSRSKAVHLSAAALLDLATQHFMADALAYRNGQTQTDVFVQDASGRPRIIHENYLALRSMAKRSRAPKRNAQGRRPTREAGLFRFSLGR